VARLSACEENAMFESLIDGYEVCCRVVCGPDSFFKVEVRTRLPGSSEDHLCKSPGELVFDHIEDAERRARYVLLGVNRVDAQGEPRYVVI
jgi:hypothetical protein